MPPAWLVAAVVDVFAVDVTAAEVAATDVLVVDAAVVAAADVFAVDVVAAADDWLVVVPPLEHATSDAITTIKMAIIPDVPIFCLIEDNYPFLLVLNNPTKYQYTIFSFITQNRLKSIHRSTYPILISRGSLSQPIDVHAVIDSVI